MNLKYNIRSKKDIANIYLRLYFGRVLDVSKPIGIFIKKSNWDSKNEKVRNLIEIKNRNEINSKLLELKSAILSDYNNDYINGIVIDGSWLDSKIKGFFNRPKGEENKEDRSKNLYITDYAAWWLKEIAPTRKVSSNKVMNARTITHYQKAFQLLKDFEGKNKITFQNITKDTFNEFSAFLTDKKGYATATAKRMIVRSKFFCERAEEDNITVNKNFKMQVFVTEEIQEYTEPYLNESEINKVFNLDLSHDNVLDNARDNFVIGLWTGLRVTDFLKRLNISNIKDGYIQIKTQKTNTSVTIPIHPQVQKILNKRAGFLPTKINEPDFNKKIKTICQLCDIDQEMIGGVVKVDKKTKIKRKVIGKYKKYELIASHVCRRSFATNLFGLIPNQDIIKILGWSSDKMLYKYNKTTNKESADKLKAVWNTNK